VIYFVFYDMLNSPGALIFWGSTLTAATVLWFLPPMEGDRLENTTIQLGEFEEESIEIDLGSSSVFSKLTVLAVVIGVAFVLAGVYSVPANALEERTLATQTMDEAAEIDEFPQVNPDNARIAPRAVADVQARGSVSYRQYRLGTSDIARMEDGDLAWSYPVQPDGFRNRLGENQQGVVVSSMTAAEDRDFRAVDDRPFDVGEGMFRHRGSDWNLKKTDYWAQYRDDAVEFVHEGTPYMAYPKTGHEWNWTPLPHTTPTWEGVALVHPDGTIDHLSPEEAQESEILEGQRLYPLYNTRRKMDSLGHREGIINQWPVVGSHENEIEPASLPAGAGNSQPFVIDLEGEQMSYVTAMEPYGEDTRGLDEVWFADAETGELRYFATERETLLGPERATGIARSADRRTDWDTEDSQGQFKIVEPVPVTIDGELWWHMKVVPVDNTDVTRNVFVNSDTEETIELRETGPIKQFIAGEDVNVSNGTGDVGTEPAPDEDIAYYIVIENEDGEVVERVPVEEGEEPDVNFVPADQVEANVTDGSDGGDDSG